MKTQMANEAKTGLIVVISAALLLGLVIKVGNFSFFHKGYKLTANFHFTAGIKKHAPLKLAGVDIGEVSDIRLVYGDDTIVEVDLSIDNGVKIKKDSVAYVTTLGLMGEKYVEIRPGTSSEVAQPGDRIEAEDPVRFEELMKLGTQVAKDVGSMAKTIDRTVGHIDDVLVDGKPKIARMLDNFEETSENFRDFSQDIKFHPWKILAKGKEKSKEEMAKERAKYQEEKNKKAAAALA
jgi:phospholipid/cholesterol/gamma-HCH transport system substrate-binding protein